MNLPIEVIEAINEARCLLVVGSRGPSEAAELQGATYPEAKDLARDLGWKKPKATLGARQKRDAVPSVFEGAREYEKAHGRDALVATLTERLGAKGVRPSPAYASFLRRFPLVLTTCRDDLLEQAGKELGGVPQVAQRGEPLPAFDVAKRGIYKLWGSFGMPLSLVLTPEDLASHALSVELRKEIRTLIRQKVVLFVGFRPDEEEFELLWGELTECYGGELPRCHLAVAQGIIDDYMWQKWVWRGLLMFTADPVEAMSEMEARIAS